MLRAMTLAPTMSHQSWLVVARDLYPESWPATSRKNWKSSRGSWPSWTSWLRDFSEGRAGGTVHRPPVAAGLR